MNSMEISRYLGGVVLKNKKDVYVPKIISNGIMEAHKIENLDFDKCFLKNSFGIFEPKDTGFVISPEEIDFAVIPMVAGDRNLNRLGYGGGYYDRFRLFQNIDAF